jgi:hypothetical protein
MSEIEIDFRPMGSPHHSFQSVLRESPKSRC